MKIKLKNLREIQKLIFHYNPTIGVLNENLLIPTLPRLPKIFNGERMMVAIPISPNCHHQTIPHSCFYNFTNL